jgi:hypothetical protein
MSNRFKRCPSDSPLTGRRLPARERCTRRECDSACREELELRMTAVGHVEVYHRAATTLSGVNRPEIRGRIIMRRYSNLFGDSIRSSGTTSRLLELVGPNFRRAQPEIIMKILVSVEFPRSMKPAAYMVARPQIDKWLIQDRVIERGRMSS